MADLESFGCPQCWPADAAAAWGYRASLRPAEQLVDESHLIIGLRECPHCAQQFLSVFGEIIDWADGEDPQETVLIPVTPAEAEQCRRDAVGSISNLGTGRRSLHRVWPKGALAETKWAVGVWLPPHD